MDEAQQQRFGREYLALAAQARGETFTRKANIKATGTANECWTNAWKLAVSQPRLHYVEGIAVFPDGDMHTHAWCVDKKRRVYETTPGYGDIVRYIGFVLPTPTVQRLSGHMEGWRSSMLEAMAVAAYADEGHRPTRLAFIRLTGVDFTR